MPSYLDIALLGVVLVSALLSMVRGLTREVLAIASWAAAAIAAYYFYPLVMPYLEHYLPKDQMRMVASIAIVFFATLIIVSIITVKLSDAILDSRVGPLDRTLGFVFGAARGFLLCVVAFLFFNWLVVPKSQPTWVTASKSKPLLEATGNQIVAMLPEDPEKTFFSRFHHEKATTPEDAPADADPATPAPPATGSRTDATPPPPTTPKASASAAPAPDKPGLDALVGKVNGGGTAAKPANKKQ